MGMTKRRFPDDEKKDNPFYSNEDVKNLDKPIESRNQAGKPTPIATQEIDAKELAKKSYSEPDKLFRRNITLSEEQFRRLEFIKKAKNKSRSKDEDMITLDKLMFDMVQKCLDEQYPETKDMFNKYIKIKEMEDFGDLM